MFFSFDFLPQKEKLLNQRVCSLLQLLLNIVNTLCEVYYFKFNQSCANISNFKVPPTL